MKQTSQNQSGKDADTGIISTPPLPRQRKIVVANWHATTRVPRRVYLSTEELDERMKTIQSISPEIERMEERLEPELAALAMLKHEKKRHLLAVKNGYDFVDTMVMEVPDERLKLVRFVDAEGVVVGDRLFTDLDMQEKLV